MTGSFSGPGVAGARQEKAADHLTWRLGLGSWRPDRRHLQCKCHIMPNLMAIRRLVTLKKDNDHLVVEVDLDGPMPIGLVVHKGERDATMRLLMAKSGSAIDKPGRVCRFQPDQLGSAEMLVDELRDRLRRIASKPLSLKQIEKLLSLTPAERNRWSKDGRLQISGTSKIRRGDNLISLATYNVDAVERLLENPAIVEAWRRSDVSR